jgi:hypothetical protein
MNQLMQVTIDQAFLCEIYYDYKNGKFSIEWAKDCFVEDLQIEFDAYKPIFHWIEKMQTNSGLVFQHINICEVIDYGNDVNVNEDGKDFCMKHRMIDIVPPENVVKAYIMELFTSSN